MTEATKSNGRLLMCDVDETCSRFVASFSKFVKEHGITAPPFAQWTDPLGGLEWARFRRELMFYEGGAKYGRQAPYNEARAALLEPRDAGWRIAYVSHRPTHEVFRTDSWLLRMRFPAGPVWCIGAGSDKSLIVDREGADVWVDDMPASFVPPAERAEMVLIARPWNQGDPRRTTWPELAARLIAESKSKTQKEDE